MSIFDFTKLNEIELIVSNLPQRQTFKIYKLKKSAGVICRQMRSLAHLKMKCFYNGEMKASLINGAEEIGKPHAKE